MHGAGTELHSEASLSQILPVVQDSEASSSSSSASFTSTPLRCVRACADVCARILHLVVEVAVLDILFNQEFEPNVDKGELCAVWYKRYGMLRPKFLIWSYSVAVSCFSFSFTILHTDDAHLPHPFFKKITLASTEQQALSLQNLLLHHLFDYLAPFGQAVATAGKEAAFENEDNDETKKNRTIQDNVRCFLLQLRRRGFGCGGYVGKCVKEKEKEVEELFR